MLTETQSNVLIKSMSFTTALQTSLTALRTRQTPLTCRKLYQISGSGDHFNMANAYQNYYEKSSLYTIIIESKYWRRFLELND